MKDSYSFDRDAEGLDECLRRHAEAYARMCDRCGLEWYRVKADVGMMGGHGSDEYMAPCAAGENDVVLAPGYAANLEVASADAQPVALPARARRAPRRCTPRARPRWRRLVVAGSTCRSARLLKAFPIIARRRRRCGWCIVRGDHRVNEIKLRTALGQPFRAATRRGDRAAARTPGLHRPGRRADAGPARPGDRHRRRRRLRGRRQPARCPPARRRAGPRLPVRDGRRAQVVAGDTVDGAEVRIEPAIEVGNIFKLGTRYSEPLGATYLDEAGRSQLVWMGCYGFGPARAAAAAVEQYADEHGISWPRVAGPVRRRAGRARQAGHRGARALPTGSTRSSQATGLQIALRRARRRAGGEVHRRRAARLPGAADGRAPDARRRRDRGPGPARARVADSSRCRVRPQAAAELWRGLP